jgi:hypothetical protein
VARTTLCEPIQPLLQALPKLAELKIPSTTSLRAVSLPSLKRLTIVHRSLIELPAQLPSIPSLTELEFQLRWSIDPPPWHDFIDLDGLPNLQTLFLHGIHVLPVLGQRSYPNPGIFRGNSSSLRCISVRGPFMFLSFAELTRWLKQLSASSLQSLIFDGVKFGYRPGTQHSHESSSWPAMPQLRSLELERLDIEHFQALPCNHLRKLFISSESGPWQRDRTLAYLLDTAALSIEVVSVRVRNCVCASGLYHIYGRDVVNTLVRCLALRHFESVGCVYFQLKDWQFLCERAFPYVDQVHVEAEQPLYYPRSNDFARLCPAMNVDDARPRSLVELYEGRMYVSSMLSSQWLHNEREDTVRMVQSVAYDHSQSITRFLCQQFRRQADAERDLQPLSGSRASGFFSSPRLLDSVWCRYPAPLSKSLRSLPEKWRLEGEF